MAYDIDRRDFLGFLGALGAGAVLGVKPSAAQTAPGGPVPNLTVYLPNWSDQIEIWRQVARTWKEIGVTAELQQGDMSVWRTQIAGQHKTPHFVSMNYGSTPDRLDPDFYLSILHSRAASPGGLNYGHFRDAKYDELVDAQRAEMDIAKRVVLVKQAQARAAELDPSFILFYRDYITAFNSERWDDVPPTKGSGFFYLPWGFMRMKPKAGREMARATFPYDFDTMNPFTALGVTNQNIVRWIYPTLTYFDADTNLIPWVAESWTVVDPTTVDIVVRSGMKWDDGKPLTAEDVKFTIDFAMEKKFPGLRIYSEVIESVEQTGPMAVRFKLKKPYAPFLSTVMSFAFIAPKHIWSQVADPLNFLNLNPVGAGAFKLVEWRKGEYLRYESNPHFFVKPNIKTLFLLIVPSFENQMNMLEQGASDVLAYAIDNKQGERLAKNKHITVVRTPSIGFHEIRVNCDLAPLDDPALRKALQFAIDRQGLLDTIFGGAGILAKNSMITPSQTQWANQDIPEIPYDPAQAKKILADAGYSWAGDGQLLLPKKG